MGIVISFEDYTPAERRGDPATFWLYALIEQSAADPTTGEPTTWAQIDSIPLPPYTNQENPPPFSFETEQATLDPGWYRVVFSDGTGDRNLTDPLWFESDNNYRPNRADVAKILPTRTRSDTMEDKEDFDADSRPTKEQVQGLIIDAEAEVNDRLSTYVGDIPTKYHRKIRWAMTLYSALLVELTKFPDQIGTNRSGYNELKKLYDEAMRQLEQSLGIIPEDGEATGGAATEVGYGTAKFSFPENAGGLVDWTTKF